MNVKWCPGIGDADDTPLPFAVPAEVGANRGGK